MVDFVPKIFSENLFENNNTLWCVVCLLVQIKNRNVAKRTINKSFCNGANVIVKLIKGKDFLGLENLVLKNGFNLCGRNFSIKDSYFIKLSFKQCIVYFNSSNGSPKCIGCIVYLACGIVCSS